MARTNHMPESQPVPNAESTILDEQQQQQLDLQLQSQSQSASQSQVLGQPAAERVKLTDQMRSDDGAFASSILKSEAATRYDNMRTETTQQPVGPATSPSGQESASLKVSLQPLVDFLSGSHSHETKDPKNASGSGYSPGVAAAATTITTGTVDVPPTVPAHEGPAAPDRAHNHRIVTSEKLLQGLEEEEEEQKDKEKDKGRVWDIKALLTHRSVKGESGKIEFWVEWEGSKIKSWATEHEIQEATPELLFAYWRDHGGRTAVVFEQQDRNEKFWIYDILGHRRCAAGGFELKVQWLGYSTQDPDTSWEPGSKLKNVASHLLGQYWEGVGGRTSFLRKRGRPKGY